MAKRLKFKPTPAGILFLSAIGVLLIAIIILTIVGVSRCNKNNNRTVDPSAQTSIEPADSTMPSASDLPVTSIEPINHTSADPNASDEPVSSQDPSGSSDPITTPDASESAGPGPIVITTPGQQGQSSAAPSANATATPVPYYTSPTSSMKNNAQKGYVSADSVNMRKGPGKSYDLVKSKIAKNTAVTLYVEQNGWWFLKCGDKYGYIKKDYVTKGSAPATPASGEATGKVVASKIALRKSASNTSECIKEYASGEQLIVYSYKKDSNGKKWYYVKTSDGKKGYMYAEYVKVTGKVSEE